MDRFDNVVWQDREVKFDIVNVYVKKGRLPTAKPILYLTFNLSGNIRFVVARKFWTYSITLKTQKAIQMNAVACLSPIWGLFGIRWTTINLICVSEFYVFNTGKAALMLGPPLHFVGQFLLNHFFCVSNSLSSILAIGFNCILTMSTKTVLSKLRGTTLALYILTLSRNSRFEFIFTNLAQSNARKFSSVFDIYRSYQSTVLYRELKLRSAIIASGHLKLLTKEQVYSTFSGIWNLSSDQGNLGTLIVTNVRVIWYADINETFNISLPHMQIASVSEISSFQSINTCRFANVSCHLVCLDKNQRLEVWPCFSYTNAW